MKKILKRLLWSSVVTICVLVCVLGIHIYMVTRHKPVAQDTMQLSRIDFKQDIDSIEADKIRSFVSHLDGVKSTYFNRKDRILVYTYLLKKQSSVNVYKQLMNFGDYKAERYIVSETQAKSGCPVGADNQSLTGSISSYVSSLLK